MKTLRSIIVAAAAFLAFAAPAAAGSWPDARLDQAASSVAGHPVFVYCEDDWVEWYNTFRVNQNVFGFTYLSRPVVFVNPRECLTLHALVNGADVGTFYASIALLTLVHESVHQRGISDEGITECTALPLVPGIATAYFGIPQTAPQEYTASVVKRVGRRRVTVQVVRTRQVPNPYLDRLAADTRAWHNILPDNYRAGC